jgi:hypothetical protein
VARDVRPVEHETTLTGRTSVFKTVYDRVVVVAKQLHTKLAISLYSNDPSFDSMCAQLGKSLRALGWGLTSRLVTGLLGAR